VAVVAAAAAAVAAVVVAAVATAGKPTDPGLPSSSRRAVARVACL
jgi:hypothetical protein